MKILYVDYYYEYGIEERGLNYIGIDGFEKSLYDLGHEVGHFYLDKYLKDKDILNCRLLEYVSDFKPDLVFFNLYNNFIYIETIKIISLKAITVNWFGDDPFLFDRFTKLYAPFFSYCITTDRFSIEKYEKIGQVNVIYSQWPSNIRTDFLLDSPDYKYDVSFVGAKNPPREWFINELRIRGIKVETFGNGWSKGPITNEEMYAVFEKSKINLNISNSDTWDYRFFSSGYCGFMRLIRPLLLYHMKRIKILNKIVLIIKKGKYPEVTFFGKYSSQIKARNFEIPSAGGFQLTDYVPSIEEYFVLGQDIACYSSIDEAEKLIRYYLNNGSIRESMKISAYNRVLREHTYKQRLLDVFKIIENR